jgi:hypothetical protein|tara:strand:- start:684 stop:977 length:294 start_codon:yes stop_codon:yes gene_type:complete
MANLFFKKEKASQTDVIEAIDKLVDEKCPQITYFVRFTSDAGGQMLEFNLEVSEPSELLDRDHPILVIRPMWMGWRSIIMKVPIGYIDGVLMGHRSG